MKGFIEINEDSYEDTIEYLHKLKIIAWQNILKKYNIKGSDFQSIK